jgi:hypothetical protein
MGRIPKQQDLDVAVVIPLEDPRGDIVEHLRTWADGQRHPRERYQLAVAGNGEHPDFEREVSDLLAPHDAFASSPGASMTGLYAAGAEAARARVLIFTEAHCLADPDCVAAVADGFAADPDLAGAKLNFRQSASSPHGKLVEQWLDGVLETWEREGWPRFHATGVAIRADALERTGGVDPQLNIYAFSYISARLHQLGARVERLEGARLTHMLEDDPEHSMEASRDFAYGECLMRARDPEFCERYFGPAGLWSRRHVYRPEVARPMVAALTTAVRRDRKDASWLGRELAARLPARVAGARPRRTWERAAAGWHIRLSGSPLVPAKRRERNFVSSQNRIAAFVQLSPGLDENGLPPAAAAGRLGAEGFDGILVGAHSLERNGERRFRWSESVSLVRVSPEGDSVLRLRTGGLRGHPLDYLHGAYVDGEPLPGELVGGDNETLEIRLPAGLAGAVAHSGVVLICRPLVPSREGSSDTRRLGIPITEVELSPAEAVT